MKNLSRSLLVLFVALLLSCGKGRSNNETESQSAIENLFKQKADQYKIPYRILLGMALKESNLSTEATSTYYINKEEKSSIPMAESVFGLPYNTLGLTSGEETVPLTLEAQIDAYARWVKKQLNEKNIELPENIEAPDDLYNWIWQLSKLHRPSDTNTKNVQIVFTKELLALLNKGVFWQNPTTGDFVNFKANSPQVDVLDFSFTIQNNLMLDTEVSEIFSVDYFQLAFRQNSTVKNMPTGILVTHCPFDVSTCLALQSTKSNNTKQVRLGAHYIIPSNTDALRRPIKILPHREPVLLTDPQGGIMTVTNRIVVMLTGKSGRYVEGIRKQANPTWMTDYQLKQLGKLTQAVCQLISSENSSAKYESCHSFGGEQGVRVFHGGGEFYRWGDVPDYDASLFKNYITNPETLDGLVSLNFNGNKLYDAGQNISVTTEFLQGGSKVTIEFLERCENQKLIWSPLQTHFVRNTQHKKFNLTFYDSGPNTNGEHYLRTRIYDNENRLTGWNVNSFMIRGFEAENTTFSNSEKCLRPE